MHNLFLKIFEIQILKKFLNSENFQIVLQLKIIFIICVIRKSVVIPFNYSNTLTYSKVFFIIKLFTVINKNKDFSNHFPIFKCHRILTIGIFYYLPKKYFHRFSVTFFKTYIWILLPNT